MARRSRALFPRRAGPIPPSNDYRKYRDWVREDFHACCAYCLTAEALDSASAGFEIDHHRPRGRPEFAHLEHDFYNLYYCCPRCNRWKGANWPPAAAERFGRGYVDYCGSAFSEHFQEVSNGVWQPLTRRGEYSEQVLRLNSPRRLRVRRFLANLLRERGAQPIDWDRPLHGQIAAVLPELLEGNV